MKSVRNGRWRRRRRTGKEWKEQARLRRRGLNTVMGLCEGEKKRTGDVNNVEEVERERERRGGDGRGPG